MSEGFIGKLGGSDLSKMMLFMFLGLIVAILVLGFHRSPQAAPTANIGQNYLKTTTAISKPNSNPNTLLIQNSGGY